MADLPSHHFIYGLLSDYLTGESLVDTDDERYRQKIGRFLVETKGYRKSDLLPRLKIETLFNHNFVLSRIDLLITVAGRRALLLRYGPGSLVSRERPALAAARVLGPCELIPLTVVTNGEDMELLDTVSGEVLQTGLADFPEPEAVAALLACRPLRPVFQGKTRERELRILNAYDQELCCSGNPSILPTAPEG